ncbi:hypothetical protein WOLCODRAFT_140718 [Wolfiporia cocos MD-104 SS10]|uniref:Uncharacterized protein n=1 Tax=Wolfiporia cocos (strain MD-104) TaxID=742152 RepID=A0A2H3J630_WOLCO|nr:hypothetical protein WOLCODRAFT_140718 [Wolfiporia cocos MD-104 SS10]
MRNTLPILTRATVTSSLHPAQPPEVRTIPATISPAASTIHLVSGASSAMDSVPDPDAPSNVAVPSVSALLAPRTDAPRKRIVPKKSKLAQLAGKTKERVNRDFSGVVRRVSGDSSSRGPRGYDIYVHQADEPDIEEVVIVKKRKSRLGLDGLKWGPLSEATNASAVQEEPRDNILDHQSKGKGDDSQKWWSIGRGRKDSKGKDKENSIRERVFKLTTRSKTPESAKPLESRARFNSLDSSALLSNQARRHAFDEQDDPTQAEGPSDIEPNPTTGSIAIRAIKSVQSLARMTSWATLTRSAGKEIGTVSDSEQPATQRQTKLKKKSKRKSKEKGKKTQGENRESKDSDDRDRTIGRSGGKFEIDPSDIPINLEEPLPKEHPMRTLSRKKSVLGLNLSLPKRHSSVGTASISSAFTSNTMSQASKRASTGSAHLILSSSGRPTSTTSSGSSVRPQSMILPKFSKGSSSGSIASVRWDEECLRSSREMQRRERRSRDKEGNMARTEKTKRMAVQDIFPETQTAPSAWSRPASQILSSVLTEHTAANDPTGYSEKFLTDTPYKRRRPRPMSDQLQGRARPRPVYGEVDGSISVLDAVTDDLASLINRLDLEATPASSTASQPQLDKDEQNSRQRGSEHGGPSGSNRPSSAQILRVSNEAPSKSLPAVAQAQRESTASHFLDRHIAPWSDLNRAFSSSDSRSALTSRSKHKRAALSLPAFESPSTTEPLRLAKARSTHIVSSAPSPAIDTPPMARTAIADPSSATFGSRPSKVGLIETADGGSDSGEETPCPTPISKRRGEQRRKMSSSSSPTIRGKKDSSTSSVPYRPSIPDKRRDPGVMNASDSHLSLASVSHDNDADFDIPDELQEILAGHVDDDGLRHFDNSLSSRHRTQPSVSLSPSIPHLRPLQASESAQDLPTTSTMRLEEDPDKDISDDTSSHTDNDSKKSFDFTGEMWKLLDSGDSDRQSFVEQLERAFQTPAKLELGFSFNEELRTDEDLPAPAPVLPLQIHRSPAADVASHLRTDPADDIVDLDDSIGSTHTNAYISEDFEDVHEEGGGDGGGDECCRIYSTRGQLDLTQAQEGQVCTRVKCLDMPPSFLAAAESPLTLSDIIPPPARYRSSCGSSIFEDDPVFKPISPDTVELPVPAHGTRTSSDTNSDHCSLVFTAPPYAESPNYIPPRATELSTAEFDSPEIRRGYDFDARGPVFSSPPSAMLQYPSDNDTSFLNTTFVAPNGAARRPGLADVFGFGPERPPSIATLSVDMSVDDTFSFINRGRRQRTESDTSSFYFRANPSVHSIPTHGTQLGRQIVAYHEREPSVGSFRSDQSSRIFSRPGLGDKMFDNEAGVMAPSRSASPPESGHDDVQSILSWESFSEGANRSSVVESFLGQSGSRTSILSADSFFGLSDSFGQTSGQLPALRFRPPSVMSDFSVHSSRKDDDTVLLTLDGEQVRRRSVHSMIGGSPCIKLAKTKLHPDQSLHLSRERSHQAESSPGSGYTAGSFNEESFLAMSPFQHSTDSFHSSRRSLSISINSQDSARSARREHPLALLRSRPLSLQPQSTHSHNDSFTSLAEADTPPLIGCIEFPSSSGSQPSIDIDRLNTLLSNDTRLNNFTVQSGARARMRSSGHRPQLTQACLSRTSIYETIQEEDSIPTIPSEQVLIDSPDASPTPPSRNSVLSADSDTQSAPDGQGDVTGLLRRYYALQKEAQEAIAENKRMWPDTAYTLQVMQSFRPPTTREGMLAFLKYSRETVKPLPPELRPPHVRSRTSSRVSPYPLPQRLSDVSDSPSRRLSPMILRPSDIVARAKAQEQKDVCEPAEVFCNALDSPMKHSSIGPERASCLRASPSAQQARLNYARSNTTEGKENVALGMLSPKDTARIRRPRPHGRPAHLVFAPKQ